jgi:vacuolar-type H+-ATPase subunit D/Vma8
MRLADETHEELTARVVAQAATATAKAVFEAAQAAAIVVAKENTSAITAIAVLQTEMTTLKNQQTCFEGAMNLRLDGLSPKFEKLFDKLDQISTGRPTWAVTVIIAALFSLSVGLIIAVIAHL